VTRNTGRRDGAVALWLATLVLAAVLGATGGCGVHNPYGAGSYDRGIFWLERGRYQEAADAFEAFVRQNPTDSLAAAAQFQKARAYMELEEYPLAAVEFQILAQDHPTSPLVEDARFHEGECYFFQVGRIERDVTPAYEARLHWLDFARDYPDSRFMPQVRQSMQEISDLLVRKRLRSVRLYDRLGHLDAVALSLDRILADEPTSSLIDDVIWQRARLAERLEDPATAIAMYQRLVAEYPDSDHRADASDALARLTAGGTEGS